VSERARHGNRVEPSTNQSRGVVLAKVVGRYALDAGILAGVDEVVAEGLETAVVRTATAVSRAH
jgi:hypothetical protein